MHLKKLLGDFEFPRLFEVILTDNGTEFSDPESIEKGSPFAGFTLCKFYALSLLLILSVHLCSQSRSLLAKADVDDFFIILFWLFGHNPLHASV